jgi:tetratricopeptide (TPR) repeat protein
MMVSSSPSLKLLLLMVLAAGSACAQNQTPPNDPPPREASPLAPAPVSSPEIAIPPEESADFEALKSEPDPDKAIALAEAYAQKYPQSEALSQAYGFEARAYQSKNNVAETVKYAEKSVALKPDNIVSLAMLAASIPTPQFMKLHPGDEEQQLARAENYVQMAFQAIASFNKLPGMSDADFATQKANVTADLHSDMGLIHLDRAQLGKQGLNQEELAIAEREYKLAVSMTDPPDPVSYFRLGDACRLQGKIDDAIAAYTNASEFGHGVLKQYAERQIALLKRSR